MPSAAAAEAAGGRRKGVGVAQSADRRGSRSPGLGPAYGQPSFPAGLARRPWARTRRGATRPSAEAGAPARGWAPAGRSASGPRPERAGESRSAAKARAPRSAGGGRARAESAESARAPAATPRATVSRLLPRQLLAPSGGGRRTRRPGADIRKEGMRRSAETESASRLLRGRAARRRRATTLALSRAPRPRRRCSALWQPAPPMPEAARSPLLQWPAMKAALRMVRRAFRTAPRRGDEAAGGCALRCPLP